MTYKPRHDAELDFKSMINATNPPVQVLHLELPAGEVLMRTSYNEFTRLFNEWLEEQGITCNPTDSPDYYRPYTRSLIFPDGLTRKVANELYSSEFPQDESVYYTVSNSDFERLEDYELTKQVSEQTDLEFKEYSVEVQCDCSSFFMTRAVLAQSEEIAFQLAEELPFSNAEQETCNFYYEVCDITAEGLEGEDQ